MAKILIKKVKMNFKEGQVIFSQGDIGDNMYIIEEGCVSIDLYIGEDTIVNIAEFGPNDFFGEMALFGNHRRIGTAKALEETRMIVINQQVIINQLSKLPSWFVTMFKTLIQRLREADSRLAMEFQQENKNNKVLDAGNAQTGETKIADDSEPSTDAQ